MKTVTVSIKSAAPLTQSRKHDADFLDGEKHDDYEKRTWIQKAHIEDGQVFIPGMAFKFGLDAAAKRIGKKIPGKGQRTYSKLFVSGIICLSHLVTDQPETAIEPTWINANSDGVRGSGKRVRRCFPTIKQWSGKITFLISPEIENKIFEEHLTYVGRFVGVGQYRPENGGMNGRFEVTKYEWS